MAKRLEEAPISTRSARANLKPGTYWRGIDTQVHLGYRKAKRGGLWLVRWRHAAGYRRADVGIADDNLKEGTLDYDAAVREARKIVEKVRQDRKAEADGPPLTVRLAVESYTAMRDVRESERAGRQVKSNATVRLGRYLFGADAWGKLPATEPSPLADVPLHRLTEADLQAWRAGLPATMKDATKQRLTADLKAALNSIHDKNKKRLPVELPDIIKDGLAPNDAEGEDDSDDVALAIARENQILSDAQVAGIVRAAREVDEEQRLGGDLFRLVLVMAATGARYSQVVRLRVHDLKDGRLHVPRSRKGRRKRPEAVAKSSHVSIPIGADVIEALTPIAAGRAPEELLLQRWHYRRLPGKVRWEKSHRGPWVAPKELTELWPAIRDRAKLPGYVIPYSLRHSSIMRGINAGLPIRLVADAHDTSIVMIEAHYSRGITDKFQHLLKDAVVPLVASGNGTVAPQDDETAAA